MSTQQDVVDMTPVVKVLIEALAVAEDLHGTPLPGGTDTFKKNNAELAVITRDLLRLAETCRLAGAETYVRYWTYKGYADPRS